MTPGQRINALAEGKSAVLEKVLPTGSLEARRLRSGAVQFYWRYTVDTRTDRIPIGAYDPSAPPKSLKPTSKGFSIQAALERARTLSRENADTVGGVRAAEQRRREQASEAAAAEEALRTYTLRALFAEYVAWLKKRQKSSWREAEILFANHVEEATPDLAARPAAQVQKAEIVSCLRRLTEAGKRPTERKLRAYLHAAYACALRADSDTALPSAFIDYRVEANPVESIAAIRSQADKNPLQAADLRRYWRALQDVDGVIGAALRLQLISGGQRVQQLTRVSATDCAGATMRLLDPKGTRSEAREHLLPITPAMRREFDLLPGAGFVLSTDGGKTPMHPTSLSAWAAKVGAAAKIEGFQLKRVRSGIETALAEVGISREIRGQLQSHGIGGVQERHYDAHHYLPDKRRALQALVSLLEEKR